MPYFVFIIGLLFAGGGWFIWRFYGAKANACTEPVDGVVVECKASSSRRMAGIYFPVVSYSVNGVEYKHNCNGGGMNYPIGETLPLMYNPDDPNQCYAVKDSKAHRFTGPLIVVVGIGFMILAFFVP